MSMIYAIVPVTAGMPDVGATWPIEAFDSPTDANQRYCAFPAGTEIRESWTSITEEQFTLARPAPPETPEPAPALTLEEIQENQLILMDAIATLYETVSGGGE